MTGVDVQDLRVSYGDTDVVHGTSFAVPPGGWLALVGPNGSGKSSALRAICGLVPFRGAVRVAGQSVHAASRRVLARKVALVPQHPTLPPGMTVSIYVLLGRTPHLSFLARESAHDRGIALRACERLGAEHLLDRDITSLSGGEQQLVVLARAMTQQAPVLLLDEPTSALDLGHQQQVLGLIDRLRTTVGVTVVTALHDLTHAGQYADSVALLDHGRLVAQGSPAHVLTTHNIATHYGANVTVASDQDARVTVTMKRQVKN
jgi:iron complex transport system ATP-binding protein